MNLLSLHFAMKELGIGGRENGRNVHSSKSNMNLWSDFTYFWHCLGSVTSFFINRFNAIHL